MVSHPITFRTRTISILAFVAFVAAATAQTPTGNLVGNVKDSSGAVIPDARIQVRNEQTNETRNARSQEDGQFTVPNLPPGRYTISVQKEGFRRLHETGIALEVDRTVRVAAELQVGSLSETVEVTAQIPLLNTESATRGDVLLVKELDEMPLQGRDFTDLAFLVAGVSEKAQTGQGTSPMSVNGSRAADTNFLIDGFTAREGQFGGVQVRPPLESMQEFKMQVSGFSAEFGRNAGGAMNMVLKSGGNRFHGSLFEFFRNDKLDARNFFSADKPPLRQNQFGATLAGPVLVPRVYNGRDRAFFMFSWESTRTSEQQTQLARVPSTLERGGDFSQTVDTVGKPVWLKDPLVAGACSAASQTACFPGNRIPASRFYPSSQKILSHYPLPNQGGVNNLLAVGAARSLPDRFVGKFDTRISERDNVSFRVITTAQNSVSPFAGGSALGTFGNSLNEMDILVGLNYTRSFTPIVVNEFRVGLSRMRVSQTSLHSGHYWAGDFGIPGTTSDTALVGFPRFNVTGMATFGDQPAMPTGYSLNNYTWADTVTWVRSGHLVKFGADLVRSQVFGTYNQNVNGTLTFSGRWTTVPAADVLLGLPSNSSRQVGNVNHYLLNTSYAFFVQDDYKITPALTLNFGLRYEIPKPAGEKYGHWANFIPGIDKLILADDANIPNLDQLVATAKLTGQVATAREYGLPRELVYTRYRDFAPRFGVAYRPFGSNRTVIRTGYGIYYGDDAKYTVRTSLGGTFPFAISQSFSTDASNPSVMTIGNPFPALRLAQGGVTTANAYELHAGSPSVQNWNLTIERQLGANTALEAAYSGAKGTHLGRHYDINQPYRRPGLLQPDGTYPRPIPALSTISTFMFQSDSSYNAGMLTLRKRSGGAFFYRINYTFGKSVDDASQLQGNSAGGYPQAQDARNLSLERGRSDFDNRHSVTGDFSWSLPFARIHRNLAFQGWRLSGTSRIYTGKPFTPRVNTVDLNAGEANRPDRIANGSLDNPTPDRWYDVKAFPVVPRGAYRFGNSGRNVLDGPGKATVNLGLTRRFRIRETGDLNFRFEAFNVLNRTNFYLPVNFVDQNNAATITQAYPARVVQIGLKLAF
jgi:hypothetical protein